MPPISNISHMDSTTASHSRLESVVHYHMSITCGIQQRLYSCGILCGNTWYHRPHYVITWIPQPAVHITTQVSPLETCSIKYSCSTTQEYHTAKPHSKTTHQYHTAIPHSITQQYHTAIPHMSTTQQNHTHQYHTAVIPHTSTTQHYHTSVPHSSNTTQQ